MSDHPDFWHVGLTEPQSERYAAEGLRSRGYTAYLPILPKTIRHFRNGPNRSRDVIRPMFPGYVFVDDPGGQGWRGLRTCPGMRLVNSLLRRCGCSSYAVLADEIVAIIRMKERELCNMKPRLAAAHGFKIGQQVRVEEGPFIGYFAKIETLDDDGRIGLLMKLFGRDSRVSRFPAEFLASAT